MEEKQRIALALKRKRFFLENPIVIVDYDVGNILSVSKALSYLGYHHIVSSKPEDIQRASGLVLPGIGAFYEAMRNLKSRELCSVIKEEVLNKNKPLLGICVGMQILSDKGFENGEDDGLALIPGNVRRIPEQEGFRVPHVGWNTLEIISKDPLFSLIDDYALDDDKKEELVNHFYFDHSYYFECDDKYVLAYCNYGQKLAVAVRFDNIFGVQFHPEKSQKNGLKLFRSFFDFVMNHFGSLNNSDVTDGLQEAKRC